MSLGSRVQQIVDGAAGTSLDELAWQYVAEPHVVRELYVVLRRREPRLAMEAARIRFLHEEHYRRDDKIFRREMYETVEALGATAGRFAPYFVAHLDLPPFALVLGRLGDARAIPALCERLSTATGALLAAVIDALGRLQATVAVDALVAKAHAVLSVGAAAQVDRRVVANACLALGRIGDERALAALTALVTDTPPDMDAVVARAIVGLGWLGDDRATHALLPLLEGRHRNVSMYALARIADRASASHVEAVAARLTGTPEQLVYPRLMLEALRSRLGRAVDLDTVRQALTVVMASRFEDTELHETALRMMAVHADPAEIIPIARRFVDAEHPRVREAATLAFASADVSVKPHWLDRPRVEEIYRREGVRGFALALASPDAVFRHNVLRKAAEVECGAEIEGPALTTLRTMVAFPRYSEEVVLDRHESTFDALEAAARFHTSGADTFLIGLFDHPNVMIRACAIEIAKVDVYGASDRLREALREKPAARVAVRPTLPVARLGGGPWIFGPQLRGLAVDRTGSRYAAIGDDKLVVFDADGTVVRSITVSKAAAVAFERNGDRFAVVTQSGVARIFESRSCEQLTESAIPGAAKVTAASFAADGRLLISTQSGRLVKESSWIRRLGAPIAALVPNPDAPHVLVACGDRALWFDERDGSERLSVKSRGKIVDIAFHGPSGRAALLHSKSVDLCDASTLERRRRVMLPHGTKIAFAREGRALVAAVGGTEPGLMRIDLPEADPVRIARSPTLLTAMTVDPITSLVLAGGESVRVELWDLSGTPSSLPIAQHTSSVDAIVADVSRGRAFSIGADGLVLQWDVGTREIVAGWRLPRAGRVVGAVQGATGRTLIVAWGDAIAVLDLVTGQSRFERAVRGLRSIARVMGAVWLVTQGGLLSFDEAKALEGAAPRLSFRPVAPAIKSGAVYAQGDRHFVIVKPRSATILDARPPHAKASVALGKNTVARFASGLDAGMVAATSSGKLLRFASDPVELIASTRLGFVPDALAVDEGSERVAAVAGDELVILEPDLRERARVRLDHAISTLTFSERGLLVCGGRSGEISVVETER